MTARTSTNEYHGLLVLDKPGGMTSRDAVNHIQRRLPRGTRIGHTGTLDPLATGVLVICLGQATRLAEYVQALPKTYRSTFVLGATSDTDDADGRITPTPGASPLTRAEIEAAISRFRGTIEQVPPVYSAAKVAGQRAYDLAREGSEVDLKPRRVTVHRFDIISLAWPELVVEVQCSKGTYVRALARDLGAALRCGALVSVLRRTRVGPFTTESAVSLDADRETLRAKLRPLIEAVSDLPRLTVTAEEAAQLRHGQAIAGRAAAETAVLDPGGRLVAICRPDDAGSRLRPFKVIPAAE